MLVMCKTWHRHWTRPRDYKKLHAQFSWTWKNAQMCKNIKKLRLFQAPISLEFYFFLFKKAEMPPIVGISTFISRKKFMLNWVEHEVCITSVPGFHMPLLPSCLEIQSGHVIFCLPVEYFSSAKLQSVTDAFYFWIKAFSGITYPYVTYCYNIMLWSWLT